MFPGASALTGFFQREEHLLALITADADQDLLWSFELNGPGEPPGGLFIFGGFGVRRQNDAMGGPI